LHCTYDPETRGGNAPDGRKVKSTLHWVSAAGAVDITARLYNSLFLTPDPDGGKDGKTFIDYLNPQSLEILDSCKAEPCLAEAQPETRYQFERQGYFCVDSSGKSANKPDKPVFNRTVTLKDTWAKIALKNRR
jgi:glutaminyl-tRNA synthetase